MIHIKKITLALFLFILIITFLQLVFVGNMASISGWYIFFYVLSLLAVVGLFIANYMFNEPKMDNTIKTEVEQDTISAEIAAEFNEQLTEKENDIDYFLLIPTTKSNLKEFTDNLLKNIAKEFNLAQGLIYYKNIDEVFVCCAQYAYFSDSNPEEFKNGENLPGQAVKNKILVALNHIPENYIPIVSGLGKSSPNQIVFVPLIYKDEVIGLIEYASFETLTDKKRITLENLSEKVAEIIVKLAKKQ